MVRASNCLISLLHSFALICSIPILQLAFHFHENADTECQRFIEIPLLILGGALFFLSILGLIGSCCGVSFLLWFYLFLTFLLSWSLFCFTIFTVVVTNEGVGKAIAGTGYKDYRIGDYSNWLHEHVVDDGNWVRTKSCLIEAQLCKTLRRNVHPRASKFYKRHLSPLQSGCCKPPTNCGFKYKNATLWVAPKSGPAVADTDCKTWSNNNKTLCFDCKSCKAGILANLRSGWRKLAIVNLFVIIFLLLMYYLGCCALENHRSYRY